MKKTTSRARPRRPVAKGANNKAHAGAESGGMKPSSRAMRNELEELRRRLEIAEMTLSAIRSGEVEALDLTEQRHRVRLEQIQRFLADVSSLLAQPVELQDKLASMVRTVVPEFADWCSVEVIDPRGLVRAVASRAGDQELEVKSETVEAIGDLEQRFESLRRANARVVQKLPGAGLTDQTRELYRRGARSLISIPLTARGSAFGAITIASFAADHAYGPQDLAFAEELGRRAANAIDNARLYREVQDAVKARDEFMSIAAHEMRTPLMALTLQLGTLMRLIAKGSAEAIEQKIQKAIGQTDRLARLIDHLLDVSRITAGRLVLESAECDLSEVVRESVKRFADEASRAGSELRMRLQPGVKGTWDSFRLEQMVTNLVSNAIKYGDGKPIEIVVEAAPRAARLVVRDNGIGIAEKELHRVFEPFHRSTSDRRYSGLGLGLHITSQIVRAHGGEIQVKSEVGKGSSFIVELPREAPASASKPERTFAPS